jgi:hypothetical protein
VLDTARAVEIILDLPNWSNVALDVETDAASPEARAMKFDPRTSWLRTMQFAADRDTASGPVLEQCWIFDIKDMDRFALRDALFAAGIDQPQGLLPVFVWNASFEDVVCGINLTGLSGQEFTPVLWCEDLMMYEASLRLGGSGNSFYAGLAAVAELVLGLQMGGKGTVQMSYDKITPLTQEQIEYAADDAIVTLWLRRELTNELKAAGLYEIAQAIVCGSRPIWQGMHVTGLPFNSPAWRKELDAQLGSVTALEHELAVATGGGQGNLFADDLAPSFNPGSDVDVKAILNKLEPDRVREFIATHIDKGQGSSRLLGKNDSVDADSLTLMGGKLPAMISKWRKESKIESSFGTKVLAGIEGDGRLHSEFTQNLVDTGRASSRGVLNLQAFSPRLKQHMRPETRTWGSVPARGWVPRVFVHGDLSQAELRVLAQLTGEPVMVKAFADGIDQHESTAAAMFQVDMSWFKKLAATTDSNEPAYKRYLEETLAAGKEVLSLEKAAKWAKGQYDSYRQLAKPLNFGIPYGMREGLLATRLTTAGIPTTKEMAKDLLEKYYAAMVKNGAWLNARDAAVAAIADGFKERAVGNHSAVPQLDFQATWKLMLLHGKVDSAAKALRKLTGSPASAAQIVDRLWSPDVIVQELGERLGQAPTDEQVAAETLLRVESVAWAKSYMGPVLLLEDGSPFSFESRTLAGRRRLFQGHTTSWLSGMAMIAATSRKPRAVQIRTAWEASSGVKLTEVDRMGKTVPLKRADLQVLFTGKNKANALSFVTHVLAEMPEGANYLMYAAAADVMKGMANAYRNAPIQGAVADAVELCFSKLAPRMRREFPTARVVLSVHDSIVIECDLAESVAVSLMLKEEMEAAIQTYCPDVVVKADVEITASLDTKRDTIADVGKDTALVDTLLGMAAASAEPVTVQDLLDIHKAGLAEAA